MLFAALGAFLLWLSVDLSRAVQSALYILTAVLIQLRLLCNLFDGMVAIEGKRFTKSGELFNEVPELNEIVA